MSVCGACPAGKGLKHEPNLALLWRITVGLLLSINWDHDESKRRVLCTDKKHLFSSTGEGDAHIPCTHSPVLVPELAASPLRYAVLCGQLAEHEGISKRIQSGFSFKVRTGFSLPCAAPSPGSLLP